MEPRSQEIHIDKVDARAGSTPNVVRYVLFISLALVIVALSAIWIIGAANAPENTGGTADTQKAVAQDGGKMP